MGIPIGGYWGLLIDIILMAIGGYWWLLIGIILMVIGGYCGYFINGYCLIFYVIIS